MAEGLYVSLEMVEPVEETRAEVIFATEPLLSSLHLSIPASRSSPLVELDEVEVRIINTPYRSRSSQNLQIQKGILQLCKGLSFLHTSARRVHSNINTESILINSSVRLFFFWITERIGHGYLGRLENRRTWTYDPSFRDGWITYGLAFPDS